MKSSIAKSITSLPPLPKTLLEINRICADEEAGIGELAAVIEHDPMIVANLLKAAHSPIYGFGREITNVRQAVSLFGMSKTRSIALGHAVRKLLNVDMQPYGISSEKFADLSALQATFVSKWYKQIASSKADKLYLAAFLQETGKILIASDVLKDHEEISFSSEIAVTQNVAQVEKSYVGVTSAEITALVFEHWGFEKEFVTLIHYSDNPAAAPEEIKEYAVALDIVKTFIPINAPLAQKSINFGLQKAEAAGYDTALLEATVTAIQEEL